MPRREEFVMPLHYKRFMAATQDWSDEEVGCYMRLLMYQWGRKHIPSDIDRQKRISESIEKHKWIIEKKFVQNGIGLQNTDMEEIRTEMEDFSRKRSEARKKHLSEKENDKK